MANRAPAFVKLPLGAFRLLDVTSNSGYLRPFAPAGKRIALSPDSIFVRGASRHSITEAGIGTLIDAFGTLIDAQERGDTSHGTLTYLGLQKRPEFAAPVEGVPVCVLAHVSINFVVKVSYASPPIRLSVRK